MNNNLSVVRISLPTNHKLCLQRQLPDRASCPLHTYIIYKRKSYKETFLYQTTYGAVQPLKTADKCLIESSSSLQSEKSLGASKIHLPMACFMSVYHSLSSLEAESHTLFDNNRITTFQQSSLGLKIFWQLDCAPKR